MYETSNVIPMGGGVQNQANLYGQDGAEQQRINRIMTLLDTARRAKSAHIARWTKNYQYYLSIDQELKSRPSHASKLFVPRPYLVVETKLSRMVKGLLKSNVFTVHPNSDDDVLRARMSQALLNHYWKLNSKSTLPELLGWLKDSMIYGTSIGKTGWEYKQEWVPARAFGTPFIDPISLTMIQPEIIEEGMRVTKDNPFFKNIDIGSFYPDPYASSIENANYCIEVMYMPRHCLKQLEMLGLYQGVDRIPTDGAVLQNDMNQRQFSLRNTGITNIVDQSMNTYRNKEYEVVEVIECWWLDGYRKMKTTIANQKVIIQDIPMPYWHQKWPFHQLKDTPMTGEFWTLGAIDPIVDLVKELNDNRNAQADNRNQFLKAFWYVNRTGNIDLDLLENVPPGGIIEGTGSYRETLEIVRPPQLDTMTYQAQAQVDSDIQMTSGANDIAIGTSTRSQVRTATTGSLMAESTGLRYGLTGMLHAEELKHIGNTWLQLCQQFMTQPVSVRILGADGLNFQEVIAHPADIPHQYDLSTSLATEFDGDREVQKQQQLQLFQLMANVPGYQITEGAKELLRTFDIQAPERYFEGNVTVPTNILMQQLGMKTDSVNSNYLETLGGLMGGGTQRVNPGLDRAGLLETAKNPMTVPNVA